MVYLDEPEEGGGTEFQHPGLTIARRRGRLLARDNLRPGGLPGPATLHAGLPALRGSIS